MRLTVIGCGDAFGSGGRLQTSFHVSHSGGEFLIDCGATTLLGLHRQRINPDALSSILITHLHGDHFSGLAWLLIYFIHCSKRTKNLQITGPQGLEDRFIKVAEGLFPGSTTFPRNFELEFHTYQNRKPLIVDNISIRPFEVLHPSGAPSYALRITVDGRSLAFSGDTEWVDALPEAAANTDLFIAECFTFSSVVRYHLNWTVLEEKLPTLKTQKILISHMGPEMLQYKEKIVYPKVLFADDGQILDI